MKIEYQETTSDLQTRIDIHSKYGGRDIDQWMLDIIQLKKGSKILDVGCGSGNAYAAALQAKFAAVKKAAGIERSNGGPLSADIDFARATAVTAYGTCGVKVWMFHGEVLDKPAAGAPAAAK